MAFYLCSGRKFDRAGALDFDAGRDFGVGKNSELGEGAFEETLETEANLRSAQDERLLAGGDHLLHVMREFADDVAGEIGFENEIEFGGRLANALGDLLLKARIESDGADGTGFVLKWTDDLRAESATGVFGEFVGILGEMRVIADFLEDAGEIANGDSLGEEVLEDTLNLADGELGRNQFVDDGGVGLLEIIEESLHILAA